MEVYSPDARVTTSYGPVSGLTLTRSVPLAPAALVSVVVTSFIQHRDHCTFVLDRFYFLTTTVMPELGDATETKRSFAPANLHHDSLDR